MIPTFLVTDVYGRGTHIAAGDLYVQRIFDGLRDLHYKTWLNVDFARIWCITPLHSLLYVQMLFSPPNKGTFTCTNMYKRIMVYTIAFTDTKDFTIGIVPHVNTQTGVVARNRTSRV